MADIVFKIKQAELDEARLISEDGKKIYPINYTSNSYAQMVEILGDVFGLNDATGINETEIFTSSSKAIKEVRRLVYEFLGEEAVDEICYISKVEKGFMVNVQLLQMCLQAIGETIQERQEKQLNVEMQKLDNI